MNIEPQIITTLQFNKRRGDELYSSRWYMYQLAVDPNRRVLEHIYTGWDGTEKRVEIRY